jgi:hypothetical protein
VAAGAHRAVPRVCGSSGRAQRTKRKNWSHEYPRAGRVAVGVRRVAIRPLLRLGIDSVRPPPARWKAAAVSASVGGSLADLMIGPSHRDS